MKKIKLLSTIISISIFYNCSQIVDSDILASVGSTQVTSYDFIESYSNRLIQTKIQDSKFERNRTLNDLIRTKLFAEAAREKGIYLDSIALNHVQLSKELALRDALYKELIGTKQTTVVDSIIRKHFKWQHTEIKLRHLFHRKKEVLDTILPKIINHPEQFNTYAKQLFKNQELRNSGGLLGWISYNTIDPNLEQVAFSIPIGIPHGPVRSSYGWHIILKEDEKRQMILGENEYQAEKNDLKNIILTKQSQIKADNKVNNLMTNGVSINDSLALRILDQINFVVFNKTKLNKTLNDHNGERILNAVLDLKLNKNMVLATYPNGSFTVDDLLNNLRNSNTGKFLENPVQAFYIALRDKILTNNAEKSGLINKKEVQWKIKSTEDEYLAQKYLLSLSDDNSKIYFSTEEVSEITNRLKEEIPITIYKKNMELLFSNK